MAKSYAESVKLPNLVAVTHPASKLSRNGLNIEGTNNKSSASSNALVTKSLDRKNFIVNLLESEPLGRSKKKKPPVVTSTDEVICMIDEKLTTGFYGVKHLFITNDNAGRLSKESFKCVLSQLCGYINNETWQKIVNRFELNENGISFEEFIKHFENNQKVKKELALNNVQLIDMTYDPVLNAPKDLTKKILLPELSATYCLALLKAKAKEEEFDPRTFLPKPCFQNNQLVMPFHLMTVLGNMNLKLSSIEFQKLWDRLDLKNTGCIKTCVFLRLINWNPNQVDDFSLHMDVLRTRSCIVNDQNVPVKKVNTIRKDSNVHSSKQKNQIEGSLKSDSINYFDSQLAPVTSVVEDVSEAKETKAADGLEDRMKPLDIIVDGSEPSSSSSLSPVKSVNVDRGNLWTCETSMSEAKIKSMVSSLKHNQRFGFNDDLVVYLNNKLNEGYISLKAAFEYIDPDHLTHLLSEEFRFLLGEFNIHFEDDATYEKFLKKHALRKHNDLVDYEKFLQIFQDMGPSSISTMNKSTVAASEPVKTVEKRLVEFFHGASFLCFNSFKEATTEKGQESTVCSAETLRKLLEQRFAIIISNSQFDRLMVFLNKSDIDEKSLLNWTEMFEKFSRTNPWKCFKDSYEVIKRRRSRLTLGFSSFSNRTCRTFKSNKTTSVIKEEEEKLQMSDDEDIQMFSSDDEELAELDSSFDEDAAKVVKKEVKPEILTNEAKEQKKAAKKQQKKVQKNIEKLFRTKFHSITKHLAIIDHMKTGKLDRLKFQSLLHRTGLKLTTEDVDFIWKDFDTEKVPFSNLCRRFVIPDEFNRLRKIKEEIIKENEYKAEIQNQNKFTSIGSTTPHLLQARHARGVTKTCMPTAQETDYLLKKAKIAIHLNFDDIKREFLRVDNTGISRIRSDQVPEIFRRFHVPLDPEETLELCKTFSANKSSGEFDYVKFLKYFHASNTNSLKSLENKDLSSGTSKWANTNPTLMKIIVKLRVNSAISRKQSSCNSLIKDLSQLKSLFKRFDTNRKGHLSAEELRRLLSHCQISVDANELYLMQSEYDPELQGVFCYELCIKSLIDKNIYVD